MARLPGLEYKQPPTNRNASKKEKMQVIKVDDGPGSNLYVHCNLIESGERITIEVTGIKPYLYARDVHDEIEIPYERTSTHLPSIDDGEELTKFYVNTPNDLKDPGFQRPQQNDVPHTQRALIDYAFNGVIEAPFSKEYVALVDISDVEFISIGSPDILRPSYMDIETGPKAIDSIENPASPIYTVCIWFEDNFHFFYWHPTLVIPEGFTFASKYDGSPITPVLHGHNTEKDFLLDFLKWLSTTAPDTMGTWYGEQFDMPYLINRVKQMWLPKTAWGNGRVSPFAGTIPGTHHIDLLSVHTKTNHGVLRSNSLKAVAEEVCGIELEKTPGNIDPWWETDIESLCRYNVWDVEATMQIDKAKQYSEWAIKYAFFAGVDNVMDVMRASIVLDVLYLRHAKDWKVLPNKPPRVKFDKSRKEADFKGGAVREPIPGVHRNVVVADFSSLYPNIIIGGNISYETLDPEGDIKIPGTDHAFTSAEEGMTPAIMRHMYELRGEYESKRAVAVNKVEWKKWDSARKPIKEAMNASFGVSGYKGFRLFKQAVAEAITAIGRYLSTGLADWLSEQGLKVVYGDTDSVMFCVDNIEDAEGWVEKCNVFIQQAANDIGLKHSERFNLDYEKMYGVYMQGSAKKRYAGLVTFFDGKMEDDPWVEIKGFEYKRSETPTITANLQMEAFRMVMKEEATPQQVFDRCQEVYMSVYDGKVPILDAAFCPKLTRDLSDYKVQTAALKAAVYTNEFLSEHLDTFRKDDRVYIIPVKAHKGYPKTYTIGIHEDEELPDGFTPDWRTMADKGVKAKMESILDLIGMKDKVNSFGLMTLDAWF